MIRLVLIARGCFSRASLEVEQDAVPAVCLASRTREAGGHRRSPLRGRADCSAATAQVNGGEIRRDQRDRTLAQRGRRERAGAGENGPPAISPAMARREALRDGRRLTIQPEAVARTTRYCASWRVIPLIGGGPQGSLASRLGASRTARARFNPYLRCPHRRPQARQPHAHRAWRSCA